MKHKHYFHLVTLLIVLLLLPYSAQAHESVPSAPSLTAATIVSYTNTTPLWIPDGGDFDCDGSQPGAPAISTIIVPDDYTITDLDVQLSINHSRWVGDLIVHLTSPGGTTITLVDRPGKPAYNDCGFDSGNISTTLDDESTGGSVHNANPPTGPSYTSEQALSAFDGQTTQGTWTLTIVDVSFGDSGALNSWGLNFTLPPNTRPTAHDDTASVGPSGSVVTFVIGNDTDPDGNINVGSVTVLTPSTACGTAAFDGGGAVRYTNTNATCTTDSYTYTVSDSAGATSNAATVTITINQPPTANPDSATVIQGAFVDINVVGNDTDPEGNANVTSVAIASAPVCGNAMPDGVGNVRYTNTNTACSTDSFTYTLSDTTGATSAPATVNITINPPPVINTPPATNNDSATVQKGTSSLINVVANDTDLEANAVPATVAIVTPPTCGNAVPDGTGNVRYTNTNATCTTDSFTYTLSDTLGAISNAATVTITLSDVPVVPSEATIPAPPPAQLLQDMNFIPNSVVRGWVSDAIRTDVYVHLIAVNRNYLWWYGRPLTHSGQVGVPEILQEGVIQAVDIFAPSGLASFDGGITVCLQGEGALWYLASAKAPRSAELLNTFDVAEFPGFTCAGLLAPGTVILTDPVP